MRTVLAASVLVGAVVVGVLWLLRSVGSTPVVAPQQKCPTGIDVGSVLLVLVTGICADFLLIVGIYRAVRISATKGFVWLIT